MVKDEGARKALDTIIDAALTGDIGGGKISIISVSKAIWVRTGEEGDLAL